jgi:pyruvate formate lyase activating enzyme
MANTRSVLNIQRMTVHNGPGMRTLIIFKGCPLRCLWCSTPESQQSGPEIAVYPGQCIHCNKCLSVCPQNAIDFNNDSVNIDRTKCNNCGKCVDVCNAEALRLMGQSMTIDKLIEEVKKDSVMYRHSGGGVTISGGEPLLDYEFNREFLPALKNEGINIGVDTSGYVPWSHIEPLLSYIDFFLWDIKIMDQLAHKKLTGVSNELILSNARRISEKNGALFIRIPLIPGYNDSEANIKATCIFSRSLDSVVQLDLLPLHHLGKSRYECLNRPYLIADLPLIQDDALNNLKRMVESFGLKCTIGG